MNDRPGVHSPSLSGVDTRRLLAYVADLELEVDRLRRQRRFFEQKEAEMLTRILRLCTAPDPGNALPTLAQVDQTVRRLVELVRDLHEPSGYHPAHDQVVAIALRPLVEQEFRVQNRLAGDTDVVLKLDLGVDYLEWFPARLRHILDHLICNALRFRDTEKADQWVEISIHETETCYDLRLSDNGIGMGAEDRDQVFQLFYRAAPVREAGLGVGLAVVKLLVEQSGGELRVESSPGVGSIFRASLPRYPLNDFLG